MTQDHEPQSLLAAFTMKLNEPYERISWVSLSACGPDRVSRVFLSAREPISFVESFSLVFDFSNDFVCHFDIVWNINSNRAEHKSAQPAGESSETGNALN
ncbi:MAG: hypothetical protein KC777_00880 [Cyanobacteria bacterium HKST-UBA02]|nr:hypothetical protein [Cyanobacteria bacterium HKST-UBA02]